MNHSAVGFRARRTSGRLLAVVLGVFLLSVSGTLAAERPVNADRHGVAIKGYDPVAYFTDATPTRGRAEFTHSWNGATWWFASAEHRDAFRDEPEKYAPQYGGYCAWGMSEGHTAPIDPAAWKIVEGRLYLNYSASVRKMWVADEADRIRRGDAEWSTVLGK